MKKFRLILLLVFALPLLPLESGYVSSSEMDSDGFVPAALESVSSAPTPEPTPAAAPASESTNALLAAKSKEVPLAEQSTNALHAEQSTEVPLASQSLKAPPAEPAPIVLSPAPTPEASPGPSQTPNINTEPGSVPEPEASPSPGPTPEATPSPAPTPNTDTEIVYPINSYKDTNNIYLTFDDGGNKKSVEQALEVLKQNDVKCTFFVVGKYLRSYPELWKQAIEDGHQICNHTQNHKWLYELDNEGIKKEILEWETTAEEVLGKDYLENMKQEYPYLRIPYNAGGNSKRVLRIIAELGYIPIGWNIETYYAVLRHHDLSTEPVKPIAAEVSAHVTKRVKGGSIILLHFNAYDTYNLDEIVSSIKEKGFTLKLLSEHGS
jgi:peptidoglycan-N-acetylmuramic acid deacetylase